MAQLWCPDVFDFQVSLLGRPPLDLLSALHALLPGGGSPSGAQETVLYLVQVLMLQAIIHCALWVALERGLVRVWPAFARVTKRSKRMYVVANLMKSLVLCMQVLSPTWWYYSYLHMACSVRPLHRALGSVVPGLRSLPALPRCDFAGPGQALAAKLVSAGYVSTDVAALAVVPRLPTTTVIHHISTFVSVIFLFSIELGAVEVGQKLLMYGFWSTLAFRCVSNSLWYS